LIARLAKTNNLTIDGVGGGAIAFQNNVGAGTNGRLGAVTIATATDLTVSDAKSFNAVSFEQQDGSGTTTFGGTVNTSGQIGGGNVNGIDIMGNNVRFKAGVTTTGSGAVTIDNAGTLTIDNNANFSVNGKFDQVGGGTTVLGGNITTADADISFNKGVTLSQGVTLLTGTGAGNITFTETVDATMAGTETLALTAGSGNITFTGLVGDTDRLGALTINSVEDLTITAGMKAASFTQGLNTNSTLRGTGVFTLDGDLDTNAGAITISSATVDLNANVTTTAGGANGLAAINAGSGGVDLATLKTITTSAAADSGLVSGAIDINSDGNVNLVGNLVTTGAANSAGTGSVGGAVTIDTTGAATISIANITTTGGASTATGGVGGAAGQITLNTNTGTITLNSSTITAAGGAGDTAADQGAGADITFSDSVLLAGGAAAIDTGATGGHIEFQNTVNGGQALTLTAGAGNVTLTGVVGGTDRLGAIDIVSATNVTANAVTAASLLQQAGSGTTTFNGAIDTNALAGVRITGTHLALNNTINTTAAGTVTFDQSGTATIAAAGDITADGAVSITAAGGISTAGDITTTDDNVTFKSATTLTGNVVISTDTAAGTVAFNSTLDSDAVSTPRTLAITAGTGNIDFDQAVGNTAALGAVTINSVATLDTDNVFKAASFTQTNAVATTGLTRFDGTVTLSGNFDFTGTALTLNAALGTSGNVEVSNTGLFTTAAAGDITATGTVIQNGTGTSSLAGDITTTNNNISFASAIRLSGPVTMSTGTASNSLGNITFSDVINGAQALTLTAGGGDVVFNNGANVGYGTGSNLALASLNVSGANITLRDVNTLGAQTYTASDTIDTNSTYYSDGGAITFAGNVVANSALAIATTTGNNTGAAVTFGGTLNSANGLAVTLDIDAGTGDVEFDGDVGAVSGGALGKATITTAENIDTDGVFNAAGLDLAATTEIQLDGLVTSTATVKLAAALVDVNAGIRAAGQLVDINAGANGLTIDGGAIDTSGVSAAGGAIDIDSVGSVAINSALMASGADVNTGAGFAGGDITIDVTGDTAGVGNTITLTANVTSDGGVSDDNTGAGGNGGDITLTTADGLITLDDMSIQTAGGAGSTQGAGGAVTFNDEVELAGASVEVDTGASAGTITFADEVDSAAGTNLTLTAGAGDVAFDEAVGVGNRLGNVTLFQTASVTISEAFKAARFSQGSNVAGTGTFTLDGDLDTDAGLITISSHTVDLNANVTTTAGGSNGQVAITAGAGGVDLANGQTITTTAATAGTISGAILIDSDGDVNLVGDLDTTGSANAAGTGGAGGGVAIRTLTANAAITVSDITTTGGESTQAGGTGGNAGNIFLQTNAGVITLDASTITAAGGVGATQGAGANITFDDAIELSTAASSISTGATGGDIRFNSTIDGAQALTLTAGTGSVTLGGIAGDTAISSDRLASLTVTSASAANLNNVFTTGAQAITADAIALTGTTYATDATANSTITLTGPATIEQNTTMTASNVTFTDTLDSDDDGASTPASLERTLSITGNAVFGGAVGGAGDGSLGSLTVSGTSDIDGGAITTTGIQTYTGAVTLGAATTLASTNTGDIDFQNTLDGAFTLTVNTAGATIFGGAVGNSTELVSLTTDSAGTVQINGGIVKTSGVAGMVFNEAATLGADATLTAAGSGAITFADTLNGAFALTANTAGITTFGGAVGGVSGSEMVSLTTDADGTTRINGGAITTAGTDNLMRFGDNVTLGAATTLTAVDGDITFDKKLDSAASTTQALTLDSGAGDITFTGLVGSTNTLGAVTVSNAADVTVNGDGYRYHHLERWYFRCRHRSHGHDH